MCECKRSDETGTDNGYMCPWHLERYLARLTEHAEREGQKARNAWRMCVSTLEFLRDHRDSPDILTLFNTRIDGAIERSAPPLAAPQEGRAG